MLNQHQQTRLWFELGPTNYFLSFDLSCSLGRESVATKSRTEDSTSFCAGWSGFLLMHGVGFPPWGTEGGKINSFKQGVAVLLYLFLKGKV